MGIIKGLLALTTATPVDPTAWQGVIDALTGQFSVTTAMGVVAAVVTAGVGLVFAWWGVRKVTRGIMSAFKKGKLSV